MNSDFSIGRKLLHPLPPIMLYLFMAITTLHMQIPILLKIHIEFLTLSAVLINSLLYILLIDEEKLNLKHPLVIPYLLGLLFITSPLITSLCNQDMLLVLKDDEYKDLFKMIIFGPILFFFLQKKRYQKTILHLVIFFYVIFGVYFLYRFLVLHEVRDFDLRPLLKIRHGDANFLCTFFAMMTPLPLMTARHFKNQNKHFKTMLAIFASLFFFICSLLTQSRMGIIAIVLGLIYLASRPILSLKNKIIIALILFISMVIVIFNSEGLLNRYADIQDKSNVDRYLTWQNGIQVFKDNPLIGAGMHKSPQFFYQNTHYPHFQSEFRPLEVHNTFLKVAAELGLIGLMAFVLLFLWPWKKSFQKTSDNRYFLLCSMGILTLSIMTIGPLYKDLFILHLFIIAGLSSSISARKI
jgi:O-antigen ligase